MIQHQPGVTDLLVHWRGGDEEAGRAIMSMVYDELRRLAGAYLRRETPGHTLQPTALVHEAYLRLVGGSDPGAVNRAHLIGIAARSMRQILVNHALRQNAAKRGGGRRRIALEPALDPALSLYEDRCLDLVALDEALGRLEQLDARLSRVVELRFFGGLTIDETAAALGTSARTVERDWTIARAWLRREIGEA